MAGLDQDYLGKPFEPMPALMAEAEEVTKTRAICVRCGAPASRTQRLVASDERVVVGAAGLYEARCRRCFEPGVASVDEELPLGDEALRPDDPEPDAVSRRNPQTFCAFPCEFAL